MNLRELVTSRKGTRTYETLSKDCGGYPSGKRLQQLATKVQKNFPDPDTVRALAKGLRVPEVRIVLAAAEDLGIDVSRATPRVLDYLPPDIGNLEDRELEHFSAMVEAFMNFRKTDLGRFNPALRESPGPIPGSVTADGFGIPRGSADRTDSADIPDFIGGPANDNDSGSLVYGDALEDRRESRKTSDAAPPVPEDVAAHDPGEPSQGDQRRGAQDSSYDIDQDPGV